MTTAREMADHPPSLIGRLWLSCGFLFFLSLGAMVGINLWNASQRGDFARMVNPAFDSALAVIALSAVATAIFGHMALRRGWLRFLGILLLPAALLVLALSSLLGRASSSEIDRVTLNDGRIVILAISPMLTDVDYEIWRPDLPHGLTWSSVPTSTNYSEDGAFVGGERLALSPNGEYLVIQRGGILTDCMRTDAALTPCSQYIGTWGSKDPERWLEQSRAISALTGIRPS